MIDSIRSAVVVLASSFSCLALLGCSPPPPPNPSTQPASARADTGSTADTPSATETQLSARLVDARNIELTWNSLATEECGWFVEFNIGSETDFSILTIVPPQHTSFQHRELAADTTFSYRVRPAVGGACRVVSIATGQPSANGAPQLQAEGPLDEPSHSATPATTTSLRTPATAADATPAELTATLWSPSSVDLRWRDRAADEDGYLVEVSLQPDRDFAVCALLGADATSFRKAHLPPATTCYFRVRAFVHGKPSNRTTVTTPAYNSP